MTPKFKHSYRTKGWINGWLQSDSTPLAPHQALPTQATVAKRGPETHSWGMISLTMSAYNSGLNSPVGFAITVVVAATAAAWYSHDKQS